MTLANALLKLALVTEEWTENMTWYCKRIKGVHEGYPVWVNIRLDFIPDCAHPYPYLYWQDFALTLEDRNAADWKVEGFRE